MFNYESKSITYKVRAIQWTGSNRQDVQLFLDSIKDADYEWYEDQLYVPSIRSDTGRVEIVLRGHFIRTLPGIPDEIVQEAADTFLSFYHQV